MIDRSFADWFSLAEAPGLLPRRRKGRKVHVSTLYRWATVGCRGIVLETLQVGGTRCTSRESLQRFFEALSASKGSSSAHNPFNPSIRTEARRLRDSEAAARRPWRGRVPRNQLSRPRPVHDRRHLIDLPNKRRGGRGS